MNMHKAAAIAASAYNVCGPRTGAAATPATISKFGKTNILRYMSMYLDAHDGSLYSRADIVAAIDLLSES